MERHWTPTRWNAMGTPWDTHPWKNATEERHGERHGTPTPETAVGRTTIGHLTRLSSDIRN